MRALKRRERRAPLASRTEFPILKLPLRGFQSASSQKRVVATKSGTKRLILELSNTAQLDLSPSNPSVAEGMHALMNDAGASDEKDFHAGDF